MRLFCLEPAEQRLTRDGNPVSASPRIRPAPFSWFGISRLVTKDQIMEAVWPDSSFVEEGNHSIDFRFAQGAERKEGDLCYIETVPKKGYRSAASVKEVRSPKLF